VFTQRHLALVSPARPTSPCIPYISSPKRSCPQAPWTHLRLLIGLRVSNGARVGLKVCAGCHAQRTSDQFKHHNAVSLMAPAIVVSIHDDHHRQHTMAPAVLSHYSDGWPRCYLTSVTEINQLSRCHTSLLQGTQPSVVHTFGK